MYSIKMITVCLYFTAPYSSSMFGCCSERLPHISISALSNFSTGTWNKYNSLSQAIYAKLFSHPHVIMELRMKRTSASKLHNKIGLVPLSIIIYHRRVQHKSELLIKVICAIIMPTIFNWHNLLKLHVILVIKSKTT